MTDAVTIDRNALRLVTCLAFEIDDVDQDEADARAIARHLLDGLPTDATVPEDLDAVPLVPAVHRWPTNAHLIADVSRLGYLDGRVVDVTYGLHGGFWKVWRPDGLTTHDRYHLDGVDFRQLPHPDDSFDALVIDGPYKLSGTPSTREMDLRFGVEEYACPQERHDLICAGIVEAARVVKLGGRLLVKCQDQVNSGRNWWQTDIFTRAAEAVGFTKIDRFDLVGHARSQPMDGRTQQHSHGRASTLLVFRKDRDPRQQTLELDGLT